MACGYEKSFEFPFIQLYDVTCRRWFRLTRHSSFRFGYNYIHHRMEYLSVDRPVQSDPAGRGVLPQYMRSLSFAVSVEYSTNSIYITISCREYLHSSYF